MQPDGRGSTAPERERLQRMTIDAVLTPGDVQVLPPESEAERERQWLAQRRQMITGTDVAAILGLSPFRSPIQVWEDKRGTSTDESRGDQLEFGRRFQRPILDLYADRLGHPIEHLDPFTVTPVPGFTLLGASLDARWLDLDRRPVDAKNVRNRSEKWGEAGSDTFPVYYQLQLAVQMMATETQAADLAVCFGGCEFAAYTLHRDAETDDMLREEVTAWWNRHIVQGEEPGADASKGYAEYLTRRYSRHSERSLDCDPFLAGWAKRLADAREALEHHEAERSLCENAIKAAMADAQAIRGVCSWRSNRDSTVTDWQAVAGALEQHIGSAAFAEVVRANTTTKAGARVFRFNPKGLLTNGK